jgi:hypothetical protein
MRKRGKDKDKGKELGVITDFQNEEESMKQKQKGLSNGFYVYVANMQRFGLIKTKKTDTQIILKIKNPED